MTTLPFTIFPIPTILLDSAAVTATGTTTANTLADRFGTPNAWISVKDFGAQGDGGTDDTAAIQAAFNAMIALLGPGGQGGILYFPVGNYICNSTLNFYKIGGGTGSFSIIGASNLAVFLNYQGSGTFINFSGHHCYMSNLTVSSSNAGTGTGINLGRPGGSGNNSQGLIFENVSVGGFNIGIDTGGGVGFGTSSETSYLNLTLSNCNVGVRLHDFNANSHSFFNLSSTGNTKTIQASRGGPLNIWGGSSGVDGIVFSLEGISGNVSINGFLAQTIGTNFVNSSTSGGLTNLKIDGCVISGDGAGTPLLNIFGSVRADICNSFIGGIVHFGDLGLNLDFRMSQCGIFTATPFEIGSHTGSISFRVEGCYQANGATDPAFVARFTDEYGFIRVSDGTIEPSLLVYNRAAGMALSLVSELPAAASSPGGIAMVSDATVVASGNFGAIVAGTGGNTVPVYSDGTNWRIG